MVKSTIVAREMLKFVSLHSPSSDLTHSISACPFTGAFVFCERVQTQHKALCDWPEGKKGRAQWLHAILQLLELRPEVPVLKPRKHSESYAPGAP